MDEILAVILKDTYALTQLKSRLRVLKSTLVKTFFGSKEPDLPIPPQDLNWLKSLPESFYQKFNKDNIYQIFTELEAKIPKLSVLTMYLVFEPDFMTLNEIGITARTTFSQPALLVDIKLNPGLIAGTALVWKGIYKDYSVKAKIEQGREEILQEFKKFLR